MEWMLHILVLFNVHFVVLNQDDSTLVMILSTIVWRAKNGDHRWESSISSPSVHLVSIYLDLMSTNHRDEVILAENFFYWLKTELH